MKKILTNTLLFACSSVAFAIQLDARSESQCGFLSGSIYCLGGLLTGNIIDNQLYQLPISNLPTNKTMLNLSKEWNIVYASNNESYVVEARRRSNSAVYNNGKSLFITGGYSFDNNSFVNQTISYHVDTNSWETLNTYTDNQGRRSQIYNSAVVSLTPAQNKIVLFGGDTEYPTWNSTVPIQLDSSNRTVMHAGYTTLTVFDLDTLLWSSYSPQANAPTLANTYSAQSVVFNPRNNLIYYLGGFSSPSSDYTVENKVNFKSALVFNTTVGGWLSMNFTGTPPSGRNFPTATLLPNSNDILLYGGTSTGTVTAFTDFCYTLNLDQNQWTRQNIDTVGVNSAPRFAHSAVLVNTTLFIMFGLVVYNTPLNDILALNVKDVNNLYFPDTYPYIDIPKTATPSAVTSSSGGLSKGAIAGIAVGCVIAGLALSGALLFFYLRRKKLQKQKVDEMSVDWEQVENFYTEDGNNHISEKPASFINTPERNVYSPNAYNDDNYTARESTTLSNSSQPAKVSETLYLVKPSAVDDNETRASSVKSPVLSPTEKPDFA